MTEAERQNKGVPPSGSGHQPTASAAVPASSQSGVPNAVDFAKLRAERDAAIQAVAREMHIKLGGDPNAPVLFHCRDLGGCYCACASGGPCEHQFGGWREFDDGCGGEQVCKLCGEGAMSHSMRFLP